MRTLAWNTSFRRAFKRWMRKHPSLQSRIFETLEILVDDPFHPSLKTHKLSGQLQGLWACWVAYDCCIIFAFAPDPNSHEDMIVLIDLGSHDDVY